MSGELRTLFRESIPTYRANLPNRRHCGGIRVPGLNRTTLLRPAAEGLPYLSTMEFDSKDDFLAWLRSDSFKAAHSDDQAPGMQAPSAVEQHTLVEDIVSEK